MVIALFAVFMGLAGPLHRWINGSCVAPAGERYLALGIRPRVSKATCVAFYEALHCRRFVLSVIAIFRIARRCPLLFLSVLAYRGSLSASVWRLLGPPRWPFTCTCDGLLWPGGGTARNPEIRNPNRVKQIEWRNVSKLRTRAKFLAGRDDFDHLVRPGRSRHVRLRGLLLSSTGPGM
jgi:hypothetical protein